MSFTSRLSGDNISKIPTVAPVAKTGSFASRLSPSSASSIVDEGKVVAPVKTPVEATVSPSSPSPAPSPVLGNGQTISAPKGNEMASVFTRMQDFTDKLLKINSTSRTIKNQEKAFNSLVKNPSVSDTVDETDAPVSPFKSVQTARDIRKSSVPSPAGIAKGLTDASKGDIPFLGAPIDAVEIGRILYIEAKLKNGKELDNKEVVELNNFFTKQDILAKKNLDTSYRIGANIRTSLTFSAELGATATFALPSGGTSVGALIAKTGVKKGVKEITTRLLSDKVTRDLMAKELKEYGLRGAKISAIMVGSQQAIHVPEAALSRMLGTPTFSNNMGTIDVSVAHEGQDVPEAIVNAITSTFIETSSEFLGGIFSIIPKTAKHLLVKSAIIKATLKKNPNHLTSVITEFFKKSGWNGIVGEMGEEQAGNIMYGIANNLGISDMDFKMPTKEDLAEQLLTFALMGRLIKTLSTGHQMFIKENLHNNLPKNVKDLNGTLNDIVTEGLKTDTPSDVVRALKDAGIDQETAINIVQEHGEEGTQVDISGEALQAEIESFMGSVDVKEIETTPTTPVATITATKPLSAQEAIAKGMTTEESLFAEARELGGEEATAKRQGFSSVKEWNDWLTDNKDAFRPVGLKTRLREVNEINDYLTKLKAINGTPNGITVLGTGKEQITDVSKDIKKTEKRRAEAMITLRDELYIQDFLTPQKKFQADYKAAKGVTKPSPAREEADKGIELIPDFIEETKKLRAEVDAKKENDTNGPVFEPAPFNKSFDESPVVFKTGSFVVDRDGRVQEIVSGNENAGTPGTNLYDQNVGYVRTKEVGSENDYLGQANQIRPATDEEVSQAQEYTKANPVKEDTLEKIVKEAQSSESVESKKIPVKVEKVLEILRESWSTGSFVEARGEKWKVAKEGGVRGVNSFRLETQELAQKGETASYTLGKDALQVTTDTASEVIDGFVSIEEITASSSESVESERADSAVSEQVEESTPEETAPSIADTENDPIKRHATINNKILTGEATLEEYQAGFKDLQDNKETIEATLSKETKDNLKKRLGRFSFARDSDTKDVFVDKVLDRMEGSFTLGRTVSYTMGGSYSESVAEIVGNTTQQDLQTYAEEVKENNKESIARLEAYKKALTNPETLEDFKNYLTANKGDTSKLTPEQLENYDNLIALAGKEKRDKATADRGNVRGVNAGTDLTVTETTNTKTGEAIFVVKLSDRVEKDTYSQLNTSAKKLGGYYSRYSKGFLFKDKVNAEQFVQVGKGESIKTDAPVKRAEARKNATAEKLSVMAKQMREKANGELNQERLTNTSRRAGMANNAEENARIDIRMADTMENLANAIESREAVLLDGITARTQLEELDKMVNLAHYRNMQSQEFGNMDKRQDFQSQTATEADIPFIDKYPAPISRNQLTEVVVAGLKTKGAINNAKKMRKVLETSKEEYLPLSQSGMDTLVELVDSVELPSYSNIKQTTASYKRLKAMGITKTQELRAVLREYLKYRGEKGVADKATALERDLIGRKDLGVDFFPTPTSLAERMVEDAGIEEGMNVLEPSAGNGNIAMVMKSKGANVDVIELSASLREVLEAKGLAVVANDFMEYNESGYDAIVMNPPFSNGQDIKHIKHAFDLLKEGGTVISIVGEGAFLDNKKGQDFAEWLKEKNATVEKLDANTFQDKNLMVNTGANARLVTILKEEIPIVSVSSDAQSNAVENLKYIFDNDEGPVILNYINDVGDQISRRVSTTMKDYPDHLKQRALFDKVKPYWYAQQRPPRGERLQAIYDITSKMADDMAKEIDQRNKEALEKPVSESQIPFKEDKGNKNVSAFEIQKSKFDVEYTKRDAISYLKDFRNRLKIDFDVVFVDSILAKYGVDPLKKTREKKFADGVYIDNSIAIANDMAAYTAEHETVHLTLDNMHRIEAFYSQGMTKDKVMQAMANELGLYVNEKNSLYIEEQIAYDYELYRNDKAKWIKMREERNGKTEATTVLQKFYEVLTDLISKFTDAIGITEGDIIADYYNLLSEGVSVVSEMQRFENNGIVQSFIEEGELNIYEYERSSKFKKDEMETSPAQEAIAKGMTEEQFVNSFQQGFHGTANDFKELGFGAGVRTNGMLGAKDVQSNAIFFSSDKAVADFFAKNRAEYFSDTNRVATPRTIEKRLKITNPADFTTAKSADKVLEKAGISLDESVHGLMESGSTVVGDIESGYLKLSELPMILDEPKYVEMLKKAGYDGALTIETAGGKTSKGYAVFDPSKLKTSSQLRAEYQAALQGTSKIPMFKIREGEDAYLQKTQESFNEIVEKTEKLAEDTNKWKSDIQEALIERVKMAEIVSETSQDVKEASRFTTRTKPVVGTLTARGEDFVSTLEFVNKEVAQKEISEYLARKTELVQTVKYIRQLSIAISKAKKEGKADKIELKTLGRKLRMRKKLLEQKEFYINMGQGQGIKQAFTMIQKRGKVIRNTQDFFGISDTKAKELIGSKRINMMSENQFNDFLVWFTNNAQLQQAMMSAREEVQALLFEKQFQKEDNLRKALGLPPLAQMTEVQATLYASTLYQYQFGDVFLTKREIETSARTKYENIRTERELIAKIGDITGISRAELKSIDSTPSDRYKNWFQLSKKNSFYSWLVSRKMLAKTKELGQVYAFRRQLDTLTRAARKSRSKTFRENVWDFVAPTDKDVFSALETGDFSSLTAEEKMLADFLVMMFRTKYENLVKNFKDFKSRENYVTHISRDFFETMKDTGSLVEGYRVFMQEQKDNENVIGILAGQTGEILAFDKFLPYMLKRSDKIVPSKNVSRVALTYFQATTRKELLDEFIPEAMLTLHGYKVLTGQTAKGLDMKPMLETFTKEYLNDAKGRKIDFVTRQGSTSDTNLMAFTSWISFKYIGGNPTLAFMNLFGDMIALAAGTSNKQKALSVGRIFRKNSAEEVIRGIIGHNPLVEIMNTQTGFVQKILPVWFSLMSSTSYLANKLTVSGMLTSQEFKSGIVSDQRIMEIARQINKFKLTDTYGRSLVGNTNAGKASMQFKTWALPLLITTTEHLKSLSVAMWTRTLTPESKTSAVELGRILITGGLMLALVKVIANSFKDEDEDKDSYLWRQLENNLNTIYGVLAMPFDKNSYTPVIIGEIGKVATLLKQIGTLEKYDRTTKQGNYIGDLKAMETLKKIVTPSGATRIFNLNKETRSSVDVLVAKSVESGEFNAEEIARKTTVDWDKKTQFQQTAKIKEIEQNYAFAEKYPEYIASKDETLSEKVMNVKYEEWNAGTKNRSTLDKMERDITKAIHGDKITRIQLTNVTRAFAFYRTFGFDDTTANAINKAQSTVEKVEILKQAREEMGLEAFREFFNKGRTVVQYETTSTGAENTGYVLISDALRKAYFAK